MIGVIGAKDSVDKIIGIAEAMKLPIATRGGIYDSLEEAQELARAAQRIDTRALGSRLVAVECVSSYGAGLARELGTRG